jgi:hypothetical protein
MWPTGERQQLPTGPDDGTGRDRVEGKDRISDNSARRIVVADHKIRRNE